MPEEPNKKDIKLFDAEEKISDIIRRVPEKIEEEFASSSTSWVESFLTCAHIVYFLSDDLDFPKNEKVQNIINDIIATCKAYSETYPDKEHSPTEQEKVVLFGKLDDILKEIKSEGSSES